MLIEGAKKGVEQTGGSGAAPVARRRDAQHGRRQLLQLHLAETRLVVLAVRGLRRAIASARRTPRRACLMRTAESLAAGWYVAQARMRAAASRRLRAGGVGSGSGTARTRPARRGRRFGPRGARAGLHGIPRSSAARCAGPAGSAACPGGGAGGLG